MLPARVSCSRRRLTPTSRGSHVIFAHPDGYAIVQALNRDVIGDPRAAFRRSASRRFICRTPGLWNSVQQTQGRDAGPQWDKEQFRTRAAVT